MSATACYASKESGREAIDNENQDGSADANEAVDQENQQDDAEAEDAQLTDARHLLDGPWGVTDSSGLKDGESADGRNRTNETDTSVTAVCGNEIVEPGEVCDDGNRVDDDLCSADCLFSYICNDNALIKETHLRNEEDIEELAQVMQARNCSAIDGDLIVQESELTDLAGLEMLRYISGDLVIGKCPVLFGGGFAGLFPHTNCSGNASLTSITGLTGLVSVGGSVYIENNPELLSLSGLEALSSIGTELLIRDNEKLLDLQGLGGLTSVGEYLGIGDCVDTAIGMFERTSSSSLGFSDLCLGNTSLISVQGLRKLTSVKQLAIGYNPLLESLEGLQSLESIQWLKIAMNPLLTDLGGLNNIQDLASTLYIVENENLSSLSGLDELASVGEKIEIVLNDSLSTCQVQSFIDGLAGPAGMTHVCGNLPDECGGDSCY